MKKTVNIKKLVLVIPAVTAGLIVTSVTRPTPVNASNTIASISKKIYEISMNDPDPIETLKEAVIKDRAGKDATINLNSVDMSSSYLIANTFDRTKSGIQNLNITVNLAMTDTGTSATIGYDFSDTITVNMIKQAGPQLLLTTDHAYVDRGNTFDYSSYIGYLSSENGVLPILSETDNVDTSTEGDYYCEITAIDLLGNSTTESFTITVKTPVEIVREEEERAEREKAEEEARIKAEEEKKRQEELEAQQQQLNDMGTQTSGSLTPGYSGSNPYSGGWSNCTYGAWQAAYQSLGIALPQWGNAYEWVGRAAASGYATGMSAAAGSIAVYSNHVAYVDQVSADGSMVHIIEGGYNGHYNERWCSAYGNEQALRGYVYLQ